MKEAISTLGKTNIFTRKENLPYYVGSCVEKEGCQIFFGGT